MRRCLFSSGLGGNVGAIQGILRRGDVLIIDSKCHRSIVDGATLSRAKMVTFEHNDAEHLDQMLDKYGDKRCLVAVEGVYSMDGDVANLPGHRGRLQSARRGNLPRRSPLDADVRRERTRRGRALRPRRRSRGVVRDAEQVVWRRRWVHRVEPGPYRLHQVLRVAVPVLVRAAAPHRGRHDEVAGGRYPRLDSFATKLWENIDYFKK